MKQILLLLFISITINSFSQVDLIWSTDASPESVGFIKLNDCNTYILEFANLEFKILDTDNSVIQSTKFDTTGLNMEKSSGSFYIEENYVTNHLVDDDDGVEFIFTLIIRANEDRSFVYVLDDNGDELLKLEDYFLSEDESGVVISNNTNSLLRANSNDETSVKIYQLSGTLPKCNNNYQQLTISSDTIYLSHGGWVYIGNETTEIQGTIQSSVGQVSSIYPNPASTNVELLYNLNGKSNGELKIFDASGYMLKQLTLSNSQGKENIDLRDLSTGIYFYCIEVDGNSSKPNKLIIK